MPQITTSLEMTIKLQIAALPRILSAEAQPWIPSVKSDLNEMLGPPMAFEKDSAPIETDENLSPKGRGDAKEKVGRIAIAALDALAHTKVGGLDTRIALVEQAIRPTPRASTDVATQIVTELRKQEIRAEYRPLDPIERTLIYIGLDDAEVRSALEEAPPTLFRARPGDAPVLVPFIDPQRRQEQILARAEAAAPEQARELRDLQALRRVYHSTLETAKRAILEACPGLRQAVPVLS